jgi:poly(3-hydroxybutyrate) depolymerase
MKTLGLLVMSVVGMSISLASQAQQAPAPTPFRDQMRLPWTRSNTDYIRNWIVAGPLACKLDEDCLGGEAGVRPKADDESKRPDGSVVKWRVARPWGDYASVDGEGATPDKSSYAFANIPRENAGRALVSLGSVDAIRAWVNGKQVLSRDGERAWSPDNDLVEVELNAGDNALLIKVASTSGFVARVLETGAVPDRLKEITPSLVDASDTGFSLVTDVSAIRAAAEPVSIEVIGAGGDVVFSASAKRGDRIRIDATRWPEGPYEARLVTPTASGLAHATHLPWYKGSALKLATELTADAQKMDRTTAEGVLVVMLAHMLHDRLGVEPGADLSRVERNRWADAHATLMEYAEIQLERSGKAARVRPHGFVRLAWIDHTDGTPQFCRAYLPGRYSAARKWPLVLQLHGFNPGNPKYWDWWSADNRHAGPETEFPGQQGVIYIEPHGRGNVQYQGFGDADVMRCLAEARQAFSVDENRTYLTGDSMGGWGTWNVSTRHPELFAAIAPVFGGVDYHSQMSDEEAARLSPHERFMKERDSSWAMADGLINTPIYIHHGDADQAVNVEWSRWGVRLLQRWGYDVRYREYPGRIHEALQVHNGHMNIGWMLERVRNPDPPKVRIRSAELRNARAWWARVQRSARPLEFILVDAEVVDRNVIRLDTRNAMDVVLSPSSKLVDVTRPVRVVWNGVARDLRVTNGELRLTDPAYKPAPLNKTPELPGATFDFFNTPFAVVVGTQAKDEATRAMLEAKGAEFSRAWTDWQKFEPRMFTDVQISEADIAKYSLVLIGGPAENRVTAALAAKLPIRISADRVTIDGRSFAARDAAVQMLYPNPRNAARYVWLFAGTSQAGLNLAAPTPFRADGWDYLIDDGHVPAPRQKTPMERTNVVSGSFDNHWRLDPAYLQMGDQEIRAKGRVLARPGKKLALPAATLESLAGNYRLPNGRRVTVTRQGDALHAKVESEELDLEAIDERNFYGAKFNVWLTFEKDAEGKVTGFVGYQPGDGDFEAKRQ